MFPVMIRDDETELSNCVDKLRHLSEETRQRPVCYVQFSFLFAGATYA